MTNNIFFELSYRGTIREGFIIISIERLSCFLQDISRDISMESTTIIKVDLRNDVKCVNVSKFIACFARCISEYTFPIILNQIFIGMKYAHISCKSI